LKIWIELGGTELKNKYTEKEGEIKLIYIALVKIAQENILRNLVLLVCS